MSTLLNGLAYGGSDSLWASHNTARREYHYCQAPACRWASHSAQYLWTPPTSAAEAGAKALHLCEEAVLRMAEGQKNGWEDFWAQIERL